MSFLNFREDTFGETRYCWDLNNDFLGGSVYPVRTDQDKVAEPWIPGLLRLQSSDGSSFRMDVAGYEYVALSDLTMEYNLIEPYLDFRISLGSPGAERELKITLGTPSDLVRLSKWFNALGTGSHTASRFLFSDNGLELEWGYGKETDERVVTVILEGAAGEQGSTKTSFVLDREGLIKARNSVREMRRSFRWMPYPIRKIRRTNGRGN